MLLLVLLMQLMMALLVNPIAALIDAIHFILWAM
jgi:hypothetical protein